MMMKKFARTNQVTRGRGNLFFACVLGALATLSTFSCSHNSESQGANAPSGMAGGDNSSAAGSSGAPKTMDTGPAGGTTSSSGTGGSATPAQ
jgi:hypothetical protein